MNAVRLHLLGVPRIERDGAPVALVRHKALALLTYVALTRRRHERALLAGLLWPEHEPSRARASLRTALWELVQALGAEVLEVGRDAVALPVGTATWVDVHHFEQLREATSPQTGEGPEEGLEELAEAATLYRGELLLGVQLKGCEDFEAWRQSQSMRLRSGLGDVLRRLAEAYAARGQFARALPFARRLASLEPFDEQAQALIMRLLAWSGQRAEALRQYERLCATLAEELGVRPGVECRRLHSELSLGRTPPMPVARERREPVAPPSSSAISEGAKAHAGDPPPLALRLLGPLEIRLRGSPVEGVSHKAAALLAYLALTRRRHTREALALLLWPETETPQRLGSLRTALSHLHLSLGEHWLDVDDSGVELAAREAVHVDVGRFELLTGASSASPRELAEAVALWRGDFLQGFELELDRCPTFLEWHAAQTEHLRSRLVHALRQLITHHAQAERPREALPYALRLVELEPLDEQAHCHLMRLYDACGQHEQALAQYEACAALLASELGVHPQQETRELAALLRSGRGPSRPLPHRPPGPSRASPLPAPLASFVGREAELAALAQRLEDPHCRLLTLTGPGGVGKSVLALEAARRQAPRFKDGAWLVSLAPVTSAELLAPAIAEALGLQAASGGDTLGQLLEHLRERHLLLVLDGMEHLLGAAPLLVELAEHAPGLELLVTSQERLGVRGEWELVLEGLPCVEGAAPGEPGRAALELFVRIATRVNAAFRLEPEQEPTVVRLCRRLEGLPLALELAAAWVRHLGVEEIAAEVERDLDFLAGTHVGPERHRSLRAVFLHAWERLSPQEQGVLRRLSVFRGGASPAAALEVAQASLPLLSSLAARFLVRRTPTRRYVLHELLRRYAAEALRAAPDEERRAQERHAEHYSALLERLGGELHGRGRSEALAALAMELENARAALAWAAQAGRLELVDRALEGLCTAEEQLGHFQQAEALLAELAGKVRPEGGGPEERFLRGRLLVWRGRFALESAAHARAAALLEEGLRLVRERGASPALGAALVTAGRLALAQGLLGTARWSLRTSLALARARGETRGAAVARRHLAEVLFLSGEPRQARHLLSRGLVAFRRLGEERELAACLGRLGGVLAFEGRWEDAEGALREGLAVLEQPGGGSVPPRAELGRVLTSQGRLEEAAACFESCLRAGRETGHPGTLVAALCGQGTVSLLRGETERARGCFAEAWAVCERLNERRGLAEARLGLGRVALARGEPAAARAHLDGALRTAMEVGAVPLVLEVLVALAELSRRPEPLPQLEQALRSIHSHPLASALTRQRVLQRLGEERAPSPPGGSPELPLLVSQVLGALAA
ncbi:BTAD domain-containing putative transcriptional regulator [Archangium sp.]|uniref:AfsR/SARP family transcriptional regulator n=1 Tax=Archangium sp. TaxID=1872627 RepID=UPI00286AEA6A|nr:BTAD domain-containing putative transcriptional regulator [Archangium sp.]